MATVRKSIVIEGTRDDIRPLVHDPEAVLARDNNIYRFEPDANWPAVGSQLELGFKTFAFNIDGVATSLEYDPQTMNLVYRIEPENFEPGLWRWTFDQHDGQTTVTVEIDYDLPGSYLGKALDKLVVQRQNAKQTERTLAALKAQVEGTLQVKEARAQA
ncbi:MAG: SRPBCC family protein [Candidatus Promineifilaceae bacterium]|nr:SRPBCC family protein [Candidatus Promineifilaceae bacterium]